MFQYFKIKEYPIPSEVHLLGNGPSYFLYKQDKKQFTIGFNYSLFSPKIIFCFDKDIVKKLFRENFLGSKAVISSHSKKKHENVIGQIPLKESKKNISYMSFYSSQLAYLFCKYHNCKKINLWGHDLLFENNFHSLTDDITAKYAKNKNKKQKWLSKAKTQGIDLHKNLLSMWNQIIDIPTIINIQKGKTCLLENNKNIKIQYHEH